MSPKTWLGGVCAPQQRNNKRGSRMRRAGSSNSMFGDDETLRAEAGLI